MKRIVTLAMFLLTALCASAGLKVKHPCMDSMVLQQLSEASIWGYADAGAKVTVKPSWDKVSYSVTADENGCWKMKVKTCAAGYTPYSIEIRSGKEKLIINDVLIGEVWFASGQSNMEMPMRGWDYTPTAGYLDCLTSGDNPDNVRMYMGNATASWEPQDEFTNGQWLKADTRGLGTMSATAYYFAKKLNAVLGVPVGMVTQSFGGTRVECWMSREAAEEMGEDTSLAHWNATNPYIAPCGAFNSMILPVSGYTVRGFIWYQGCANVGEHDSYASHFSRMVSLWRELWGDSNAGLPFYAVEIAPFRYDEDACGENGALLRRAQIKGAEITPNCAIIGTNDLVEEWETGQIHPRNKKAVGDRLAFLALNRDYGYSDIPCYSPYAIDAARTEGSEFMVRMAHLITGDLNNLVCVKGLELAGDDGVFHQADWVYVNDDWMHIYCEKVPHPSAARYCWGNAVFGNMATHEGLPFLTFKINAE